jgi:hypothetical protein
MISSLRAKVKCAQLGLHYLGTGRGFETAIESIGFLARLETWPQRSQHCKQPMLMASESGLGSPELHEQNK